MISPLRKFSSADEYRRLKKTYSLNPRYPRYHESLFTAGDAEQFFEHVNTSLPLRPPSSSSSSSNDFNLFADEVLVPHPWEKNKNVGPSALPHTLMYIMKKFKKGIFVQLRQGRCVTFLPFTENAFDNEYSHLFRVDPYRFPGGIEEFWQHVEKLSGYSPPAAERKPVWEWTANNGLLRNDRPHITDHNVLVLYDMILALCDERKVPDVDFFLNRRDFPQITRDGSEPYHHLYGSRHFPLVSHVYDTYLPVLSASVTRDDRYADVQYPTHEDWARVVYQSEGGQVMPHECRPYPEPQGPPWSDRASRAVFRGGSTGMGVTPETNPRLRAVKRGEDDSDVDVAITHWNLRPRKHENSPYFETVEYDHYPTAPRLDLSRQSHFKYIIHIEGHVAAFRLSYELSCGSVILMVESEWTLWYSKWLKPWVHYIPVSYTQADLNERIEWCRLHDEECRLMGERCRAFYDRYLGRKGVLDYWQKMLDECSVAMGPIEYPSQKEHIFHLPVSSPRPREHMDEGQTLVPAGPRCAGRLAGLQLLFDVTPIDAYHTHGQIGGNRHGTVYLLSHRGMSVAMKVAGHVEKAREHAHEAHVGREGINRVLRVIPHFAHTFGVPAGAPLSTVVASEYVTNSDTLAAWMAHTDDENALSLILIQINLALKVAQDRIGFIHYDCFPWNIMIQTLSEPIQIDYPVLANEAWRVTTRVVPVLIDFGKSRVVIPTHVPVLGKEVLMEHGMVNRWGAQHALTDTLTLLTSCLKELRPSESSALQRAAWDFIVRAGLSADRGRYCRFGQLFEPPPTDLTPLDLVKALCPIEGVTRINLKEVTYRMARGNPIQLRMEMKTGGNKVEALAHVIKHIDKSTLPHTPFLCIREWLFRQWQSWLFSIEWDVEHYGDSTIHDRWEKIRSLLYRETDKIERDCPNDNHLPAWALEKEVDDAEMRVWRRESHWNPAGWTYPHADEGPQETDWSVLIHASRDILAHSRLDRHQRRFYVMGPVAGLNAFSWLNRVAFHNAMILSTSP